MSGDRAISAFAGFMSAPIAFARSERDVWEQAYTALAGGYLGDLPLGNGQTLGEARAAAAAQSEDERHFGRRASGSDPGAPPDGPGPR